MRLATIDDGTHDGRLVIVSSDGLKLAKPEESECRTVLRVLETWEQSSKILRAHAQQLDQAEASKFTFSSHSQLRAPLPRSFAFLDGSAFLEHVKLARRARGAALPSDLETTPLMYQGISDTFLASGDPIELGERDFGLDFEGEFAVITTSVPRGVSVREALSHIALIIMINDWSYRNLLPREANTGFGFIQSKPPSSVAPFAVSPDFLGDSWLDGRVNLDLEVRLNTAEVGRTNGSEMHFTFAQLIAHAARTRNLSAGTIIGGGTVSNKDPARGFSCIAEKRAREMLADGVAITPFLNIGDKIELSAHRDGINVFGSLINTIV